MSRQFHIFCGRHGKVKTFDADDLPRAANAVFDLSVGVFDGGTLETCSDACLAAIEAAVIATRKLLSETPEQQRERLRKESEARGYRSPTGITELDGTVRFRNDGKGRNAYEFVDFGPKSRPTAVATTVDRGAPVTNPNEDDLFTNPSTGVQWSRKDAYALAGGTEVERKLFRRMMNCNLARLNSILAGN